MALYSIPFAAFHDSVWLDANRFYDAERQYYEISAAEKRKRANPGPDSSEGLSQSSLATEIAYARQKIQNFLKARETTLENDPPSVLKRIDNLEKNSDSFKEKLEDLTCQLSEVFNRMAKIEETVQKFNHQAKTTSEVPVNDMRENIQNGSSGNVDEDDLDLFGSEEENEDEVKLRDERLQAYANKKAKKPALVAKSSVVLDVKPWDDETDMQAMEAAVREINPDGLIWGASKLVPLAYGIKKLQIVAIVEDEKVSVDWLQETISNIEDVVQSVDIAAFNKL